MPTSTYPPLRPAEPRPAQSILPADGDYRLPSSSSISTPSAGAGADAGPGPSSANGGASSPASTKRRTASALGPAKKRRSGMLDANTGEVDDLENGAHTSPTPGQTQAPAKQRDGPKKKKAARACYLCQKAHLTCDDARPCQRCVKRGMGEKCTEGHRKKAKYLLEEAELDAAKQGGGIEQQQLQQPQPEPQPEQQLQTPQQQTSPLAIDTFPSNDIYFGLPLDQSYTFGSEAANLEYSSLSAILGLNNYSPDQPFLTETPPASASASFGTQFANSGWPAEPSQQQQQQQQPNIAPQALMGEQPAGFDPSSYPSSAPPASGAGPYAPPGTQFSGNMYEGAGIGVGQNARTASAPQLTQQQQQQQAPTPMAVQRLPSDGAYAAPDLGYPSQQAYAQIAAVQQQQRLNSSQSISGRSSIGPAGVGAFGTPPLTDSPMSGTPPTETTPARQVSGQEFYASIVKPYSYVESYAFLMKYLHNNFPKNDILRVIRALAVYRPSMIALQAPLTEADFIFMERCLRRSLVELERLMTYTGTPTVIWRRTGEICAVAEEFCLLTEWKRETLLTGAKHIYELFELQSVIEYWEKFASHAFENTTQSVSVHCVLLKPTGEPIPCTFCFSIRRDLFDMPSLVIGQWLPLM